MLSRGKKDSASSQEGVSPYKQVSKRRKMADTAVHKEEGSERGVNRSGLKGIEDMLAVIVNRLESLDTKLESVANKHT